jgi:hypothetical protein
MSSAKPYVDYRFLGVKSFTSALTEQGIAYTLFSDPSIDLLFESRPELLSRDEDSIEIGKCTSGDINVYFVHFGIKITPNFRSYIVFIFDHHPGVADMLSTADELEPLILKHLDGVNITEVLQRGEGPKGS